MSTPYPDARSWAQDHSLANVPRLARLEGIAFQSHPEVVETFGADGQSLAGVVRAGRGRSRGRSASTAVLVVLGILILLAPVIGVAIYGDAPAYIAPTAEPYPAEVSVPISGICFAVAALTQLVLAIVWLRGGARRSVELGTVAGATTVLAVFAAIGLPNVSAQDGFDLGAWIVPVWATILIAGPLTVAIILRRGVRPDAPAESPDVRMPATVSDRERARLLAAAVPAPEREVIAADRDDALRILADRGLIDADVLERALVADLGTLFTLDPIRSDAT